MSTTRTTLVGSYAEKATAYLSATITDTDGVTALADADSVLLTLTLTLYEARTGTIINSCTARDILNANGGAVNAAGALSVRLDAADMACVSTAASELHVALIEWTWSSPVKSGKHEIAFTVTNLLKVT
jgi:hypothetical protein